MPRSKERDGLVKGWAIGLLVLVFACFGCAGVQGVKDYNGVPEIVAPVDSSVRILVTNDRLEDVTFWILTSNGGRFRSLGLVAGEGHLAVRLQRDELPFDPCIRIGAHLLARGDWTSDEFCLSPGNRIYVNLKKEISAWAGGQ